MAKMRELKLKIGLMSVDCSLERATEDRQQIDLNQIHKHADGSMWPVGKKDYCKDPTCPEHKEIPRTAIGKGYPIAKGQWVEVDPDVIKNLKVPSNGAIIVNEVVERSEFLSRPHLIGGTYYLTPVSNTRYPATEFALVHAALGQDSVAVGRTVLSDKTEAVAIVAGSNGCLVMYKLRYADEIRPEPTVTHPPVDKGQLQMVSQMIGFIKKPQMDLSAVNDFEEAKKLYCESLAAGVTPSVPVAPAITAVQPENLTERLKASLELMTREAEQVKAKPQAPVPVTQSELPEAKKPAAKGKKKSKVA
jgi:Ku protein